MKGGDGARAEALLENLLAGAPVGVAFIGRDERMLRVNAAFRHTAGLGDGDILGHRVGDVFGDVMPAEALDDLRQVLATGDGIRNRYYQAPAPARPGVIRDWLANWHPVTDVDGRLLAVGVLIVDVTQQLCASRRLERLYAVTVALSVARTTSDAARAILGEVMAELGAGSSSVWLREADDDRLHLVAQRGFEPGVREKFTTLPMEAWLPGPEAVRSGEPVFITNRAERDERWPLLVGTPSPNQSIAVLPLDYEGTVFGCIAFGYADERPFDDDDRHFLGSVASQCGQTLDRVRLAERAGPAGPRVDFDDLVRQVFTQTTWPDIPGHDVAAACSPPGSTPLRVWGEAMVLDDGRVALVAGGVSRSARGLEATRAMAASGTVLREHLLDGLEPVVVLERLARFSAHLGGPEVTASCVRYDPQTGDGGWAGTGCGHPAVIGPRGRAKLADPEFQLRPGEALFTCLGAATDKDALRAYKRVDVREPVEDACATVVAGLRGDSPGDDLCVVALKRHS